MEIAFRTRKLQRCFEDSSLAFRNYGQSTGTQYIRAVILWKRVGSWSEARRYRPWRLHALRGDRKGLWACELGARARLIVSRGDRANLIWIEEVSDHYGD